MNKPDKKPDWLSEAPEPELEPQTFNGMTYLGWRGVAALEELEPWIANPRVDIPVENWKQQHANQEPGQLDMLDIMLRYSERSVTVEDDIDEFDDRGRLDEDEAADERRSPKNKLLELAESIRLNNVRIPLIVTSRKSVIDGNRRYFATLWLQRDADDADERRRWMSIPVWVLPSWVSREEEDRILTELNAINDCFVKWPYSVTARRIADDFKHHGLTIDDLAAKYHNYTKGRIKQTLDAAAVADQFIEEQGDSILAKEMAYKHLIWFDELRRSNPNALRHKDFRDSVFDMIMNGEREPFSSHADFKHLEAIYNEPEAWNILTTSQSKEALRRAKFMVDQARYEERTDANTRVGRINDLLSGVIDGPGFANVDEDSIDRFHDLAVKVPGSQLSASSRARHVTELLDSLTSRELEQVSATQLQALSEALDRVHKQVAASKESGELSSS